MSSLKRPKLGTVLGSWCIGLYAKAKSGKITGIHGYDVAFEEPMQPDFILQTDEKSENELVQKVFEGIFG